MLIVFQRTPVAAPTEPVTEEETVAEVLGSNLVGEHPASVNVRATGGRLHEQGAVRLAAHTGVVEGVDVDGQPQGMLRETGAAGNGTVAIAGGVVGLHGNLIVIVVLGDGTYALNGVLGTVQFGKNLTEVLADGAVADDDALMGIAKTINVLYTKCV